MSDNLKLWRLVETTDPANVVRDNVSGQRRTMVKAHSQKEKATEMFGPQGQSWGVIPGSENYQRIPLPESQTMLQYTATLYYEYEGKRGELPIAAAIMESRVVKRGKPDERLMIDNEAIKKVRTDAVTKGLSELGFNADIYKGWHDQQGYSEYASDVVAEKREEEAEKQTIEDAEAYAEWKSKELGYYDALRTVKAITTAFNGHIRKATKMNDKRGIVEFTKAKDARIEQLKKETKEAENETV